VGWLQLICTLGRKSRLQQTFAIDDTSKVIIAVRSIAKGNAAQAEFEATPRRTGVMEMWELDLSSYGSVKVFQPALQSCRVASCECCGRQCKYCDDEIRSRRGEREHYYRQRGEHYAACAACAACAALATNNVRLCFELGHWPGHNSRHL
jgi:Pyruvate/2-oxoacid:ferredoxin oxidoreductase delta subunit